MAILDINNQWCCFIVSNICIRKLEGHQWLSVLKKLLQDTKAACYVIPKNVTALNNPGKYLNGACLYSFSFLDSYKEVF